jgi:hypothetical protein
LCPGEPATCKRRRKKKHIFGQLDVNRLEQETPSLGGKRR